jgi:acyl-coenzyme A synthetase/AMP-(fatty) acid ligase
VTATPVSGPGLIEVIEGAPADGLALIELRADGERREWSFGQIDDLGARLAGTLAARGVGEGDTVMTLIGNRLEWALTMVACLRLGAAFCACTEQLRTKDLAERVAALHPKAVVADPRNLAQLEPALEDGVALLLIEGEDDLFAAEPAPRAAVEPTTPALITFTSGTSGTPKGVVHGHRYMSGQALQAEHWMNVRPGDIVWCTASSGWSKSARNAFVAPWLRGATALFHDGRFDPAERLAIAAREKVSVFCMAPTEYRVIGKRAEVHGWPELRELLAAGEALGAETLATWLEGTGVPIRDGYGQTETGQVTSNPPGEAPRPGSMGLPLPGVRAWVEDRQLVVDPTTVPTFFVGYLGQDPVDRTVPWQTGDHVEEGDDGYLYFEGRADDVIISSGYRIGPFEVESALTSHEAVTEAAVVGAPDEERGSVVRAIVVLRDGHAGDDALVKALQDHVKGMTAPYKYPRIVEFVDELPKTTSGKIRRAELRGAL